MKMLNNHILEPLVHDFLHFIFISAYVSWTTIKIANLQRSNTIIDFIMLSMFSSFLPKNKYLFCHEPKEPMAKETISIELLVAMPKMISFYFNSYKPHMLESITHIIV